MSDSTAQGPSVDWKQQGEGPHSTLAGNMLDPGVSADGALHREQGVGGASESTQRQEGLEHIKQNTDMPSASSTGTGGLSSDSGVGGRDLGGVAGVAPGSNPGADDTTAGIQSGSGGTVMDTVKGYLGLGGSSSNDPMEARNAEGYDGTSASGDYGNTSSATTRAEEAGAGALGGAAVAGGAESESGRNPLKERDVSTMGSDPESNTAAAAGRDKPTDSDVTTGAPPTDSADPTTRDTADTAGRDEKGDQEEAGADKPKKNVSDKEAATRENKDAIPTAGGEKLGQKHWGESKIVPDNPKPQNDSQVSSSEGQPTDQVRDNTAKNTGGASGPGDAASSTDSDAKKEGLVDKVKDKLHIGHK